MDKLGKSLDQLISESVKQEHRQNNNNNQQRQRHQQNQQDKKQTHLDQRRNIPRQNNNNSNNRSHSTGNQHNNNARANVNHNNNTNSNSGGMKVVTIERPRIVDASNHSNHHQNVFGRLGSDQKTVVIFDNLRASVTDHDVRELASAMGKISDLLLHVQPNGSKTVRVSFDRADDARKCVTEYNGITLDGQAMRVSISSDSAAAAPASVFARIQQPTGSSFHQPANHTNVGVGGHIAPALSTLNNHFQQNNQQNNTRVGLFGTALPLQKNQNQNSHNNNNRRVEVNHSNNINNNNNQFKRERKEVTRVVKGRPQQQSRQVEVTGGHLDDQLNNYFARK